MREKFAVNDRASVIETVVLAELELETPVPDHPVKSYPVSGVATPDTGYDFTGWSGTGVSNSSSASTTVSMTEARSLTANFSLKSYTLSLTAGSGGTVSGAGSFDHGTNPTIAATPDTGYDFTGWSGTGVSNSSSASTTVSMTEARSLTANFSLKSYTLSLTAGSGGTVSGAPETVPPEPAVRERV